jgi:hypothetical protein
MKKPMRKQTRNPMRNRNFLIGIMAILVGCAQSNCKRGEIGKQGESANSPSNAIDKSIVMQTTQEMVRVFKYTGELQCNQGKEITQDKMAQELATIKIFHAETKSDGQMRTMNCGSNVGRAHVFTISRADLLKAKKAGFNEWTFE